MFCYTTGQNTGRRITESGFNKVWRRAGTDRRGAVQGAFPTISAAPRSGYSYALACPNAVAMRLTGRKTLVPASRAARIDPIVALRVE